MDQADGDDFLRCFLAQTPADVSACEVRGWHQRKCSVGRSVSMRHGRQRKAGTSAWPVWRIADAESAAHGRALQRVPMTALIKDDGRFYQRGFARKEAGFTFPRRSRLVSKGDGAEWRL